MGAAGHTQGRREVTVVIPSRDRWPLLRRALRSALGQQDVDAEVIVVDDGSTDDTAARLAEQPDERLRVVRHQRSCGVAAARNAGIAEARGDWVAFLDDDDLWAPAKLRLQLDAAAADKAAFTYVRAIEVDERLRPLAAMDSPDPAELPTVLFSKNMLPTPSVVAARTERIRSVGGFDEGLRVLADWDLWLRLTLEGRAAECPLRLAAYVRHGSNMLTTDLDRVRPEFERLREKHAEAARSTGVEFGERWLDRWDAGVHLAAGRRASAARAYVRAAATDRDPGSLAHAAGVLLGAGAHERMRALRARRTKAPAWLAPYRDAEAEAGP